MTRTFITLLSFLFARGMLLNLAHKALFFLGMDKAQADAILFDSILGLQLVALFVAFTVFSLLPGPSKIGGAESLPLSLILKPSQFFRSAPDVFFRSFLWVGFLVLCLRILGLTSIEGGLESLSLNLVLLWIPEWLFQVGVFTLWYLMISNLRALLHHDLTKISPHLKFTSIVLIGIETLLWSDVLGVFWNPSRPILDQLVLLVMALLAAMMGGIPFLHRYYSKQAVLRNLGFSISLLFIFGFPLGYFERASVLKSFEGPTLTLLFDEFLILQRDLSLTQVVGMLPLFFLGILTSLLLLLQKNQSTHRT